MKKGITVCLFIFLLLANIQSSQASPWAENKGYFSKTGGKLTYGLKNVAFGWMMMFAESKLPQYHHEWEGFCVGISRSVIYTANGLIHIATFPIPVDFPNVGRGVYIPKEEPPSSKKGIATPSKPAAAAKAEIKTETAEGSEPTTVKAVQAQEPLAVAAPSSQVVQGPQTETTTIPVQRDSQRPQESATLKAVPTSPLQATEEPAMEQNEIKVQKMEPSVETTEDMKAKPVVANHTPPPQAIGENPPPAVQKSAISASPAVPAQGYVPAVQSTTTPQGNYVPGFVKNNSVSGKTPTAVAPASKQVPIESPTVKADQAEMKPSPVKKNGDPLAEYNERFTLRDELYNNPTAQKEEPAAALEKQEPQDSDEDLTTILQEAGKYSGQEKN